MTSYATWEFDADVDRDYTFNNAVDDLTPYVISATWTNGMSSAWEYVAPPQTLNLTLDNSSGAFNPDDSSAAYYGKLQTGVLVRIRATGSVTDIMYLGRIRNLRIGPGEYDERTVTLTCEGLMRDLHQAREYIHVLQENVTTDVALAEIFKSGVIAWPYASSYWVLEASDSALGTNTTLLDESEFTDFSTGQTTHEFVGDLEGGSYSPLRLLREIVDGELGGRFWWDTRTGKFMFHDRHYDFTDTSTNLTMTQDQMLAGDYIYGEDLRNHVSVNYRPRELGTPGSVIASYENVPVEMKYNTRRKFKVQYRDPDQNATDIAAKDVIYPVAGIDVIANSAADGSGADMSRVLAVGLKRVGARSAKFNIRNIGQDYEYEAAAKFDGKGAGEVGKTVYLTLVQLRGTPIKTYDNTQVDVSDTESINDYGIFHYNISVPMMGDDDNAEQYAYWIMRQFKDPYARYASVTFSANVSDLWRNRALSKTVGEFIRLTNDWNSHDENYRVVGERHSVKVAVRGSDKVMEHDCTWIIKPDSRIQGWKLGVTDYGELGQTTYLVL